MKIDKLVINKLWGRFDLFFVFDSDVNILTGINGSGKTTILNILYTILSNKPTEKVCCEKYDSATVTMSGGYEVVVRTIDGIKTASYTLNGKPIKYEEFEKCCYLFAISTFDSNPVPSEQKTIIQERMPWVMSELDFQLADAILSYHQYRSEIAKVMYDAYTKKESNRAYLEKMFFPISQMERICNELFAPKLSLDNDAKDIQFILHYPDEKRIISPKDLSSGEKQLLILLINTMIQNNQECVVFWDEPELSLHIDWQKKLIESVMQINPQMQLVLATHSPAMLYGGWENRVVNVQKLMSYDRAE